MSFTETTLKSINHYAKKKGESLSGSPDSLSRTFSVNTVS